MPDNLLDNAFYITVMFIGLSTFVGMIIKKLHRDKCLKDFAGYMVTLEEQDGKDVWGKLRVENTGSELAYPEKHTDSDGHPEASSIVYTCEFASIAAFVRYPEGVLSAEMKRGQRELVRT